MAVNQRFIEGSWNQVKGRLRERWCQLTDNELEEARGDTKALVGLIQKKTGEATGDVEAYLEDTASEGASVADRAKETAVHTARKTGQNVQQVAGRAADSARTGYLRTARRVQDRPVRSLAVCFGAGLIIGALIGLLARSK